MEKVLIEKLAAHAAMPAGLVEGYTAGEAARLVRLARAARDAVVNPSRSNMEALASALVGL